jgi:hypothetical protein
MPKQTTVILAEQDTVNAAICRIPRSYLESAQAAATGKGIVPDAGNACRYRDGAQAAASVKGSVPDGGNARGYRISGTGFTCGIPKQTTVILAEQDIVNAAICRIPRSYLDSA